MKPVAKKKTVAKKSTDAENVSVDSTASFQQPQGTININDLLLPKEEDVTIEMLKDVSTLKEGQQKTLPKSLAMQMVKLRNAKIV